MTTGPDDLVARQKELLTRIYAGALDPSTYQELLKSWDMHFAALGDASRDYHLSDFDWAEEWVDHFERAGAMFEQLAQAKSPPLSERVASEPGLAMLVDGHGRIAQANAVALRALDCALGQDVAEMGFAPESATALETLWRGLARDGEHEGQALLRHFAEDAEEPVIFLADVAQEESSGAGYVLLRSANASWHEKASEALRSGFGLTPAEVDLVQQLYLGRTIKEVSDLKQRSQATLRTQLSAVLNKIGVKSQTGLARVVSGLIHVLNRQDVAGACAARHAHRLQPEQRASVMRVDSVDVDLVESGDVTGLPFFFVQTTTWPTLTPPIVAALAARGIRLLSPHRSGTGRTTRTPVSVSPADWARVYVEMLDRLGIERICVGGHCSGGIYALELARRLGARCGGVLLVDTGVPLTSALMLNQMPLAPRRLFLGARYYPRALRTPYKLATADFYSGPEGEARGVQYFVEDSPVDMQRVRNPAIWRVVRDNFDYCVRNPEQAQRDVVIWSRDNAKLFDTVQEICPLRFLHGAENLIHRADRIRAYVERHGRCSARILDGEAQLGLYTHPEVLAEEILQLQGVGRV